MRIAIAEVDSRTNVRSLIHSIGVKYRILSDPIYAIRNGRRYLLLGVGGRG